MIRLIEGRDRNKHPYVMEQMFRLRKRVFADRLGWKVTCKGSWEIDEYDALDPLYVLAMDETGEQVVGSLRLLPTTGPNMLADTFYELLPDGMTVKSATIWESSRYCVDTELASQWSERGVHQATAELLMALCEIGIDVGLTHIVTVIDLRMERILRRMNCFGDRIGMPRRYGAVTALAGLWDTSEEMLLRLRTASGIAGSVLEHHRPDALVEAA
jgi:acyl homoserine lactone synthase